tara:strand:- start:234 stop:755 length:522 start_codon:yes stop_codon:yes gene_type:complete
MNWRLSHRFDPAACAIADRHYNRQTIGSPQCAPPGACVVLLGVGDAAPALWISSLQKFQMHAWPGTWNCSAFRNEGKVLSSTLILEAMAVTRSIWGEPPEAGMITFINAAKIRKKRDPGRCYRKAGFFPDGYTQERNLLCLRLAGKDMPPAELPIGATMSMFPVVRRALPVEE